VTIFVISTTLNYLDRSLLNVLAPLILKEFHLNQLSFGYIISAFSLTYAFSSLGAGLLLDRIGLNKSIAAAISWWSIAGILTALTTGFGGLLAVRAALGIGESSGVPAFGKLNATYLKPSERALGAAVNNVGLSLGPVLAALALPAALVVGWRIPFAVCGAIGLFWIPAWWLTSRRIPPQYAAREATTVKDSAAIWATSDLWVLVIANVLWMGGFSLWNNWVTLYLTHVQHVSLKDAARYVWIPPLVSTFGGFFGGWLSLWWMNRRTDSVAARQRAIWVSAIGSLSTLALPFANTPATATAIISLSSFFLLAGSVNIYALPIDIFGAQRAGSAVAALTFAFGLLQTIISPVIGWLADRNLYSQVVWLVTIPVLFSALTLLGCSKRRETV
jgi:ACS family hexuronate transporter-like MFS transporter